MKYYVVVEIFGSRWYLTSNNEWHKKIENAALFEKDMVISMLENDYYRKNKIISEGDILTEAIMLS